MKCAIVYIFPSVQPSKYVPLSEQFAASYQAFPPGKCDHELYVISNGPPLDATRKKPFIHIAKDYLEHDNTGRDIGAYQMAAHEIKCDLLVCLGSHIHFWRAGWIDRIVDAFLENGPALYGAWGFHEPADHIRTTAFWCPPELLDAYPFNVGNAQRYSFEHGDDSITSWSQRSGFEPKMVTWEEVLEMKDWRHIEPHECLMLDQFCDGSRFK